MREVGRTQSRSVACDSLAGGVRGPPPPAPRRGSWHSLPSGSATDVELARWAPLDSRGRAGPVVWRCTDPNEQMEEAWPQSRLKTRSRTCRGDLPFRVEPRGVEFIPRASGGPGHVTSPACGRASVNVEYFIYGAILIGFGFSFLQTLSLIIIGNLSYFLLGLASLQGPDAGTTVFGINRAAFGPNGNRVIAFFNWLTQLGFEVEGLILIVGASLVS